MANRPIIDIEVNDAAFQRFLDLFNDYSSKLDEMPESWKNLGAAIDGLVLSSKDLGVGATDAKEAFALAVAPTVAIAESLKEATKAQAGLSHATETGNRGMKDLAKTTKGLADSIFGMGKWLLKFGAVGLGLGALTGGIGFDALAGAALSRSRAAGGLGINPGQLASFQVNAQQFLGTGALQNAASAQVDVTKAGYLAALGIDFRHAQAEDAGSLAFEMLRKASSSWNDAQKRGIPPAQTAAIQSYLALGGSLSEVRNAAANPAELNAAERATRRDAGALNFDRATAQSWITLKKTLDEAGMSIQTSLIRSLAPLAPQIADLSKEVVGFINTFLNGKDFGIVVAEVKDAFKELVSFLRDTDWKGIGADIKQLGSEIVGALRFLHLIPQADEKPGDKPTDNNNPLDPKAWQQKPLVQAGLGLDMLRGDLGNFVHSKLDKAGAWWQKERDSFYGATVDQAKKVYDLGVSLGVTKPIMGAAGASELRQPSMRFESAVAKGLSAIEGTWGSQNPDSGALGKWQFMPSTADSQLGPAWVKAHGSTTTAAGRNFFLKSQSSQLRAFNSYYNDLLHGAMKRTQDPKKIARLIALGWYGGEGSWDYSKAKLDAPQTYGGHAYPSLNSYADKFEKLIGGDYAKAKPGSWAQHLPKDNHKRADASAPSSPHGPASMHPQILKALRKPVPMKPVHISVTNSTSARVAVSANATAFS